VRWWIVGLALYAASLGTLYAFAHLLGMNLWIATLLSGELLLLLRFLINDRWVFHFRLPTWHRLWQYHLASAGGASVWWIIANVLPNFGVHYLLAATAGSACAAIFGMATNFLWIWHKRSRSTPIYSQDAEHRTAAEGSTALPDSFARE